MEELSLNDKEIISNTQKTLYTRNEDTRTFGSYPQTRVTDEELTKILSSIVGKHPTDSVDYGYYLEGEVVPYMFYIDIEYNDNKYRGVYYRKYRPSYTNKGPKTNHQEENGYPRKIIHWFKYEPITWTIKEELNGKAIIVSNNILDSQDYCHFWNNIVLNKKIISINDYEYSHIREWLNNAFYNTAFNKSERKIIQTIQVKNTLPKEDTFYDAFNHNDTKDKIYLLSKKEVTTYFKTELERQKCGTDYAKCQGLRDFGCLKNNYWLRSPNYYSSDHTHYVRYDGDIFGYEVYTTSFGVLPALKIKL